MSRSGKMNVLSVPATDEDDSKPFLPDSEISGVHQPEDNVITKRGELL